MEQRPMDVTAGGSNISFPRKRIALNVKFGGGAVDESMMSPLIDPC
jgi:hypothetical protein